MAQNVRVIWLDNNIDENNVRCQYILAQLRTIVHNINTFTDADECIDFLTDIRDESALMIVSGTLCRIITPLIHYVAQLHAILVFHEDTTSYVQPVDKWFKIKGILSEVTALCKALKQLVQQCEQNAISISFVDINSDLSNSTIDQLDPSFMYTQILKEILITVQFEQNHIKEFTDYCRTEAVDDRVRLDNINKFEREYQSKTPIWWYTHEYFLYSMLNRALRQMDVITVINMGFFVTDLHRHIEQLHNEQFGAHYSGGPFALYRGQGVSNTSFDQLITRKHGLISFNNFLSTSRDRNVSLAFAESNLEHLELVGILFVMTIDPSKSTTPFASITNHSHYQDTEEEVLFSMHTVFRIDDITPIGKTHRLFIVNLTLTSDTDEDLNVLTVWIREDTFVTASGWYRLGQLLIHLGQYRKALLVYENILKHTREEMDRGPTYHQIAWCRDNLGDYNEAIVFYEKAIDIAKQSPSPNYNTLARSYHNLGMVYFNTGEYSNALLHYDKALAIREQILSPNHPEIASSYDNIGNVYSMMGAYSSALFSHQKALEMRRQSLPPNHPDLSFSYGNIGNVYAEMGEHSKAISAFERVLKIQQRSLPSDHPDVATSYNNIGAAYGQMGDYAQALLWHEKALGMKQKMLPSNHSTLKNSYNNIGISCLKLGEYSKALSAYAKLAEIQQQSLPASYCALATTYRTMAQIHMDMCQYSKALLFYEMCHGIYRQLLPSDHPDLARSYNNIGSMHVRIGQHAKALPYYEKAVEIGQKGLSPNLPDLETYYMNIGFVYDTMGEHSKSLSCYEKAVEICQKIYPTNHPTLACCYNSIGVVHRNMGKYSEARTFYELAVTIGQCSLPTNHPDLQLYRKNIAFIKKLE